MKLRFLLPLILLTGCGSINAPTPTTAPTFYSQAALQLNNFSVILGQAQTLFVNAHTTGLVSDADFQKGEAAIAAIAKNGDTIDQLLVANGNQASVVAAIRALIAQVATTPQLVGIKNPQSQAEFTALFTALGSILNASLALVQPGVAQ